MNNRKEIINRIFENKNKTSLTLFMSTIDHKNDIDKVPIYDILSLDKNRFSEEGLAIIETLETDKDFPFQDLYRQLKWKLICLNNVQDVLTGTVYNHGDKDIILGSRNYFYYEGLHLLREYFYCGFNNYLSAAEHLLRTFVEFNIKQCYFDFACREQNSFKPLIEYFKTGISKSPLSMAHEFLPQDDISKPIKKRIQTLLKTLSIKSSHAYKPIDSLRGNGKLSHEYSIDTIVFWMSLNDSLTTVLWFYFSTKPALFNPKDVTRKFGFSPPVGIFISDMQYQAIVNSLSESDLNTFLSHAKKTNEFKAYEDFYNSQSDLSDEEIMQTWDEDKKPDSIKAGYMIFVIKMRTMIEMSSSLCTFDAQKDVDESYKPLIHKISDYSWWKENYKLIR